MASAGSSRPGNCCAPRRRGSGAAPSRSRCRRRAEWPQHRPDAALRPRLCGARRRPGRAGVGLSQPGAQRLRAGGATGKRAQALFGDRHGAAAPDDARGADAARCAGSMAGAAWIIGIGLGFYACLRFHVDTTKYRRWGGPIRASHCPPIVLPRAVASRPAAPAAAPSRHRRADTAAPPTVCTVPAEPAVPRSCMPRRSDSRA